MVYIHITMATMTTVLVTLGISAILLAIILAAIYASPGDTTIDNDNKRPIPPIPPSFDIELATGRYSIYI